MNNITAHDLVMTLQEIIVSIGVLAIIMLIAYLIDKRADREGYVPRSDGAGTFIFFVIAPWIIMAGLFGWAGKWNGTLFIILLLASTAFSAWVGYHIGRWKFVDAYRTATIGGLIGFGGFGTILAINLLN